MHREERFRPSLIRLAQPRSGAQKPNQIAVRIRVILLCGFNRAVDYGAGPVSYTHLDVYKRQPQKKPQGGQGSVGQKQDAKYPAPAPPYILGHSLGSLGGGEAL